MSAEIFLNGMIVLHCGDSRDVLKTLPDNSIDSFVTDPPYALVSIVKRFGGKNAAAVKVPEGGSGAYARASSGFMGKSWDTGETAFAVEFWAECLRVLKPGGHVVAFSGTRTYHRMVVAIEDAGFEVRDMLQWLYGSGFPKSHDVALDFEKTLCVHITNADGVKEWRYENDNELMVSGEWRHPDAIEWDGFGTALKPANEPIVMARKPLSEGTVAANVLRWGTGAINVDGCRVDMAGEVVKTGQGTSDSIYGGGKGLHPASMGTQEFVSHQSGRWPANVITDGSEEVLAALPGQAGAFAPIKGTEPSTPAKGDVAYGFRKRVAAMHHGDSGSAARFFYTAKADASDRIGSKHPTIKPVDLMQWLCRLVTPPGGTVLDPFSGTGTTGEAAFREGFNAVLIEREPEYQADIRRRMALCMAGPQERKRESIKAKGGDTAFEPGSLFAMIDAAEAAE